MGIQLFDSSIDSQGIFMHKLCFTDSPKKMRVNYERQTIDTCSNLIDSQEDFEKEAIFNLTILYDYIRNKSQPLSCEQFTCSMIRANNISKSCGSFVKRL